MSVQRYPLLINVGFLINQPVGTSREIPIEFPELKLPPDLELSQVKGIVRFGRTRQGILMQCDFQADTNLECVRCLTVFQYHLHSQFSELFAFDRRSVTESGLLLREDANIDARPLLREYLLLEIPIRPLCKPDCKGLCLICGNNLNEESCEHNRQAILGT